MIYDIQHCQLPEKAQSDNKAHDHTGTPVKDTGLGVTVVISIAETKTVFRGYSKVHKDLNEKEWNGEKPIHVCRRTGKDTVRSNRANVKST